jgi:hypothetical protein
VTDQQIPIGAIERRPSAGLLFGGIERRRIQLYAKAIHNGDDRERNAGCDQAILNSGCAGFVSEEPA